MTYLLDSNDWIALIRGKSAQASARFQAEAGKGDLRTCSVVLAELWYGCARSARPAANRTAIDALVAPYLCLPYENSAADKYSTLRVRLETTGQAIVPYDLQIAAIALANGCTLVIHDTREFGRVPGLTVENWEV